MIDADGFRANVGIVICNKMGQVFWARRYGQHSWQFPQGGIDEGETAEQAMYRELHEEVGLTQKDVTVLGVTRNWLRYKLPKRLIRQGSSPVCIGQKQKWFLLQLDCQEKDVNVLKSGHPEFDDWRWVSYWYPIRNVVSFKRDVYRKVMKEFAGVAMPAGQRVQNNPPGKPNKRNRKRRRSG
ncbi:MULTISPECIES: RNA pyrophosphohydrolase [unclassified Alteromonas]|uniref:RNA pyrophosphohydrolase n=1 Tax=unclassified Alteromonas TaxID=2614992 RepID=UPI000C519B76|nr:MULTISPECIES: RNA pyrophosphohydrolase [unclassified Alteromonas]AYA63129.1 RNA pyrophosphohydrolase [Alteromonas sp. RKMC-009]MBT82652.1 RNA pyrophosphohydrolase [Alteromonadaceae bacterium]MDO6475849.1 RNA pyrophosphohydrolase [Alteromonas sp. 1_MG-2023]